MTQRDEDFARMIQDLVRFVIKIQTQVVGPQVCVLLNIALDCVSGLLESQGWDKRESCDPRGGHCGVFQGDKFGNSREMRCPDGIHMQL